MCLYMHIFVKFKNFISVFFVLFSTIFDDFRQNKLKYNDSGSKQFVVKKRDLFQESQNLIDVKFAQYLVSKYQCKYKAFQFYKIKIDIKKIANHMNTIYEQSDDFYGCQEVLLQQSEKELQSDQELQSDNTGQKSEEKIGRPRIWNSIRHIYAKLVASSHYFHSLSKSLIRVFSQLEGQELNSCPEHANRSHQELLQDLIQFIDSKVVFLQALELLTKDNFPSIQKVLKDDTNFEKNYLTQMASRTLGSALRAFRLKSDPELKYQETIELNQTMIKCLFVGSVLLIGVGRVKLNIQSKSQNINRKFQRIVIDLIRKSKLLNKTTFGYIQEYWDSIMELIVNQEIQKQSVTTMEDEQDKRTYQKKQNGKDKTKKEEKNITSQPSSKRMMDQNSSQQSEYYFLDQYMGNMENFYYQEDSYQEDSLDAYFQNEFEFSSSKKSSNRSASEIDSKEQKIVVQQFSQELQRQKRLKKRAKQIFNYEKQKRKRKPSEKQKSAKASKKPKKQKKPKKPHPPHKMRQIDILVNFIIKDPFCIAHAIANHISNALMVQNMKIKQY